MGRQDRLARSVIRCLAQRIVDDAGKPGRRQGRLAAGNVAGVGFVVAGQHDRVFPQADRRGIGVLPGQLDALFDPLLRIENFGGIVVDLEEWRLPGSLMIRLLRASLSGRRLEI